MKKVNLFILTALLTIILIIAEILIIKATTEYEAETPAIYAARSISRNTLITVEMLETRQTALSYSHKNCVRKKEDIVGKYLASDLEQGEMILKSKLCDAADLKTIDVVNKGNRLVTFEFKTEYIKGLLLKTGQYVDIIFIPDRKDVAVDLGSLCIVEGARRLNDIRIAAVISDKGNIIKDELSGEMPKYLSFEVVKGEDEFLAFARNNGEIEISVIP